MGTIKSFILKIKVMTQSEKKALASQIIGDGKLPNKFFVTTGPWVTLVDEYGDQESELLDGYTEHDSVTEVFDTYEEANEYFERIELDIYDGTAQILLEDRKTGVIKETRLEKILKVEYMQTGHSDAKLFGYEK
jgi:hypothetical protein